MNIHAKYVEGARLRDYEKRYVGMIRDAVLRHGAARDVHWAEGLDRADVIILWEGFEYKSPEYITLLENEPALRLCAGKVCSINYDDHPEGFVRGLYTSLEAPFHDPDIHRIWPFMLMNNPLVTGLRREEVLTCNASHLFSFTGAESHQVRRRLFNTYREPSALYHIEHINKWYDHGDAERRHFIDIALDSVFCLCPHGYCSYTPRITEVMAMARVPVIIADDWIPFSFPEKDPYYIQVPEREIARLPEILSLHQAAADMYRHNARALWEKYCAPETSVLAALEALIALADSPRSRRTLDEYQARWHSTTFLSQLGWTWPQRLAFRAEQHARHWIPRAKVPGVTPLMRYRNAVHKA